MNRDLERSHPGRETRVIYSCWPFGPWNGTFCGVSLVLIGGALILSELFPDSPGTIWGLLLIVLGAGVMTWGREADGS